MGLVLRLPVFVLRSRRRLRLRRRRRRSRRLITGNLRMHNGPDGEVVTVLLVFHGPARFPQRRYQNTVSRIEHGRQAVHGLEIQHLDEILGGGLLDGTKFAATFAEEWKFFAEEAFTGAAQHRLEAAESALAKAMEELGHLRELLRVSSVSPKGGDRG